MATTGHPVSGPTKTYVTDGAVGQGLAVVFSNVTAGNILQASAANAQAIGVADFTAVSGAPVRVTRQGDTQAVAGAAIAAGQYVKTNANAQLIPVTGTAGDGENIVGRAESSATAAGDLFVLYVNPSVL